MDFPTSENIMEPLLTASEARLAYWGICKELGNVVLAPEQKGAVANLLDVLETRGIAPPDAIERLRGLLDAPVPHAVELSMPKPESAAAVLSGIIPPTRLAGSIAVTYPRLAGLPDSYAGPTISSLREDGYEVADVPLMPADLATLYSRFDPFGTILLVTPPQEHRGAWDPVANEEPDEFYRAIAEVMGLDLDYASSFTFPLFLDTIIAVAITRHMHEDLRIVWWSYEGHLRPVPEHLRFRHSIRAFLKESLMRDLKSLQVVHFDTRSASPKAMIEGGLVAEAQPGHWRSQPSTAMSATVGAGPLHLETFRVRSWLEWFTRIRSRLGETGPSGLIVTDEDINVPWSADYMEAAAVMVRRRLRHFGEWKTLDSFGDLDFNILPEDLEDEWAGYIPTDEESDSVSVPIVNWYNYRQWDRAKAETVNIKPDSEQWRLQEGDILVESYITDDKPFRDHLYQVPKVMEGALLVSVDLQRLRFREDVSLSERRWIYDYLRSDLAEEWVIRKVPLEWDNSETLEEMLIPLLEPDLLTAYERSQSAVMRLREIAAELHSQRRAILSSEGSDARWHTIRRLGVRAEAVDLAISGVSQRAFVERLLLPSPIAEGYRLLSGAPDARSKVEGGLKLGEDIAAMLNAIWLTIAVADREVSDRTAGELRRRLDRGWSFGGHLWFATNFLRGDGVGDRFLSFIPLNEIDRILTLLHRIAQSRNSIKHLEGPTLGDYEREAQTISSTIADILSAVTPLATMRLIVADVVEQDPVLDLTHGLTGTALIGDHPKGWPMSYTGTLEKSLKSGTLYLRTSSSEFLSPYPFLAIRKSSAPYGLGVLQKVKAEEGIYRSFSPQAKWREPHAQEWLERILREPPRR